MKQLLKKYGKSYRAASLLVVVYAVHLFAVHALLSNPQDYLSKNSFSNHNSNPQQSVDCLLLLAKKETVKQVETGDFDVDLFSCSAQPPILHQTLLPPLPRLQCLSADSYKRYRLLSTFLI
jgi:hypothetical protein